MMDRPPVDNNDDDLPDYDEKIYSGDTTRLNQRLLLIKIPKFLSNALLDKNLVDRSAIAKLNIQNLKTNHSQKEIQFILHHAIAEKNEIPSEYTLKVKSEHRDQICMFVDAIADSASKYSIGGRVISCYDAQLTINDAYLNMKKNHIIQKNAPGRRIQQISRVRKIKPVSVIQEMAKSKKNFENKKCRSEKEHVYNMLFKAFEKHQYYNIRDLVNITQQPVSFLKEVMKEICVYCTRTPYRNMWELKPEYRHYTQSDEKQ